MLLCLCCGEARQILVILANCEFLQLYPQNTVQERTPADLSRNVHDIMGLPFDAIGIAAAAQKVRDAARDKTPLFISTPNLNFLIASQSNPLFRSSVIHSDLSLADGMPIVWLAKLLGVPITERVSGSSLFETLRTQAPPAGYAPIKVFFFGGPDGVAQMACEQLNATSQGMRCVGFASPGFGSVEDMSTPALREQINASGADFVVVSLGASKGQAWIEHNRHHLRAPVISHLGAVVNFVAGKIDRAPVWAQRSGLEWAWRIKEEPHLWRRYWHDGLGLLRLLLLRAIPLAIQQRAQRPSAADIASATLTTEVTRDAARIQLTGPWVADNLPALRTALTDLQATPVPLVLDVSKVTYMDSACKGVLMLQPELGMQ